MVGVGCVWGDWERERGLRGVVRLSVWGEGAYVHVRVCECGGGGRIE